MSRYIDADKLRKDEIARCHCVPLVGSGDNNYKNLDEVLDSQPTADVIEVVRCKDCKHCRIEHRKKEKGKESIGVYVCNGIGVVDSTFYCACGERREG